MTKHRNKNLRAFTFVELMLVVAILAVTLSLILHSFISVTLMNETNRDNITAIIHAQYVMEEIRNTYFGDIKTKIDNGDWDWDQGQINGRGLSALRSENIDTQAAGSALLTVSITVRWTERNGRIQNTQLATLIAEP